MKLYKKCKTCRGAGRLTISKEYGIAPCFINDGFTCHDCGGEKKILTEFGEELDEFLDRRDERLAREESARKYD